MAEINRIKHIRFQVQKHGRLESKVAGIQFPDAYRTRHAVHCYCPLDSYPTILSGLVKMVFTK